MTNKSASDLSKMREKVTKHCPVCGNEFKGLKTKKTCSDACRQIMHREKKKKLEQKASS